MTTMFPTLARILRESPVTPKKRAIFLAGVPGAGKTHVATDILAGVHYRNVDVDDVAMFLAKKHSIDINDPDQGRELYAVAREKNVRRREMYIQQGIPLLISGTGRDPEGIQRVKEQLEAAGYETAMLFVAVDVETAIERNKQRRRQRQSIDIYNEWKDLMSRVRQYDSMFTKFYYVRNEPGSSHGASESSRAKRLARKFMAGENVPSGTDSDIRYTNTPAVA